MVSSQYRKLETVLYTAEMSNVLGFCTYHYHISRSGAQVIDKDAASALLAELVGAEMLLLLTDAPHVFDPRKWPDGKARSPD